MKLKKLISILVSGSMLLQVSAFAAEVFDYSVDQENKIIEFTYINPDFGKTECGIAVTSKNSTIPVYATQKVSDYGGIVKDKITLSRKGWYTVSVNPMGSKDALTKEFAILDDGDLDNYWEILTTETDFETILDYWEEISNVFVVALSEDTRIFVLSKVLAENRDKDFGERNDENILKLKSYLSSEAELLAQLNKCKEAGIPKTSELLNETLPYIKAEDESFYAELCKILADKGEEISKLYADGADSVYTFAGECELLKECVDNIKALDALDKINRANHTSLISDIISDEKTAKLLGIADLLDEYLDLSSTTYVDNALYNKSFKSKDEFVEAFKTALDEAKEDEKEKKEESKGSSSKGNGGSGYKSSPVTSPVGIIASQGHPASDAELAFADIKDYGWAKSAIVSLYDKKIINGRGEGVFAPGDNVTRAEFVKMLMPSLGIEPTGAQSVFYDVSSTDWFAPYVCTANERGIANGNGGYFSPSSFITREDAAVMISRGLSFAAGGALSYTDNELISGYARDAVSALSAAGIINGMSDGSFAPKNNLTRAEAAVLLDRLIRQYLTEVN